MRSFLHRILLSGLFLSLGNCDVSALRKVCLLAKDPGPCEAFSVRYHYNSASSRCEEFIYGGCGGNNNNFATIGECKSSCMNTCFFPKEVGRCNGNIKRYHYNVNSGQCEEFMYGGCEGNENNFRTLPQCQRKCMNVCRLPKRVGPCEAAFPVYFFDTTTGQCERFFFGGCGANANNFEYLEDCKRRCPDINKLCLKPTELGTGKTYTVKWGFDVKVWECVPFVYGGAAGNENNFANKQQCQENCPIKDICHLPSDGGPGCHKPITRWHYDAVSKECVEFWYGGCFGNDNNFKSKLACQMRCPKQSICNLPKEGEVVSDVENFSERYYYDTKSKRCRYFQYGGVGGNENNFATLRECELTCPVMSKCAQAKDAGKGTTSQVQAYYDIKTRKCEYFVYRGEGGNGNRFSTRRACMDECNGCAMKKDDGPCNGFNKRWYYDSKSGACLTFIYGGCKGNPNRFESYKECVERCQ